MTTRFLCLFLVSLVALALVASASETLITNTVFSSSPSSSSHHVIKSRRSPDSLPPQWRVRGAAAPSTPLQFDIALKYRNTDVLERTFWDVSNPQHPQYGQYLSMEQVASLVGPSEAAFQAVEQWLSAHGITQTSRRMESIRVTATVAHAERLFPNAIFHFVRHTKTGISVVRHMGDLSIPHELDEHIDLILGLSELIMGSRYTGSKQTVAANATDTVITPPILKSHYNVNPSLGSHSSNNTQSIAAFSDYFSIGALTAFQNKYHLPNLNVTKIGPDCLPNCDQGESDLDVQYVQAMGSNITTIFHNQPDGYWILQWNTELINMPNPPYVNSVSYGWSEFGQCDIATVQCSALGYNSAQYVQRTDQNFQILGTRGVTILVSDGDDGSPGLGGADGNCPIDGNHYCPIGGCGSTSTQCGMITFSSSKVSGNCYFPMGTGSNNCNTILNDPSLNDALSAFINQNSACNVNLEQDTRQGYHIASTCPCGQLTSATSGAITAAGYVYSPSGGRALNPDYPTSSPFVTSVGATQFKWSGSRVTSEIGASILTGAIITTGGGFSGLNTQPSFQKAAVQAYLNSGVTLPPSSTFDPTKRGYPDVAFNGHHYDISIAKNKGDQCPCQFIAVDGTSCSSPALAGLVALINDVLLTNHKPVLGYLNQLLYQMAAAQPSTFHDITSGNNNCNRQWCCQWGFEAAAGWDPVSGLGSPNFGEWLKYITSSVHDL